MYGVTASVVSEAHKVFDAIIIDVESGTGGTGEVVPAGRGCYVLTCPNHKCKPGQRLVVARGGAGGHGVMAPSREQNLARVSRAGREARVSGGGGRREEARGGLGRAHKGRGLGRNFLRHLRRTSALLHVVDAAAPDPVTDYYAVREELRMYNPDYCARPHVVALNKMDLLSAAAAAAAGGRGGRAGQRGGGGGGGGGADEGAGEGAAARGRPPACEAGGDWACGNFTNVWLPDDEEAAAAGGGAGGGAALAEVDLNAASPWMDAHGAASPGAGSGMGDTADAADGGGEPDWMAELEGLDDEAMAAVLAELEAEEAAEAAAAAASPTTSAASIASSGRPRQRKQQQRAHTSAASGAGAAASSRQAAAAPAASTAQVGDVGPEEDDEEEEGGEQLVRMAASDDPDAALVNLSLEQLLAMEKEDWGDNGAPKGLL
ncbi:hypothetical protein HXX76_008949 [Chlamydomonas incerta]|uniref:OBG-type G domain-containing protein n=1 Tax=Chlamydomonas incerta TaxID=51695 RepID=A0A835SSW4_CHLIN|nr:hypothetical protein HXX76_008949 [Chlamydomonas incerta]|eukprot:KAG2432609.1 hypothetical protein HXX76_008949 [Chlamydomonas incerta]